MIVVCVLILGWIVGFLCACLCFASRESELQYREAQRVARRVRGA